MTVTAGQTLSHYRLVERIGAGGMGEVWKATDTTLGRDVALKILPAAFASDAERLMRFEREAKVLASLNHPNIAAIHDLHEAEGVRFLAMEMVPGEGLDQRVSRGPMAIDEARRVALQISEALEYSHERGIIHRDLKPANIRLTPDGTVKVLDFGLAKAIQGDAVTAGPTTTPTMMPTVTSAGTAAGLILGTAAFMSPEQARGKSVDKRADIWAFGVVLFEMLTGKRLFDGETVSDTIAAVLTRTIDFAALPAATPGPLRHLLARCLERDPRLRLRDIGEARIALESPMAAAPQPGPPATARGSVWIRAAVALLLVASGVAGGFFAGRLRQAGPRPTVTFSQKSFRRQAIFNARFVPGGRTIVYTAAHEADHPEIFVVRSEYPEAAPLAIPDSHLLSVSSRSELAILTRARWLAHRVFRGTLARVPLGGGAPRELLENVRDADWSPDGSQLAIIREAGGKDRLEFPIGKALYESSGYLSDLRISPAGDRIAFMEHPMRFDDRGGVAVVDLSGHRIVLADGYGGEEGLAWSPGGDTLIYSANEKGILYEIHTVDLQGRVRRPLPTPGALTIQDVAPDGAWLATSDDLPLRVMVRPAGSPEERDLSWLDLSGGPVISRDGSTVIFTDFTESAGPNYAVLLRKMDGSPSLRLGEGTPFELSPDGAWVVAGVPSVPARLMLYPTGPGEPRRIDGGEIEAYTEAHWVADGKSLFVCGNPAGQAPRCYVRSVDAHDLRPVTPEGMNTGVVSPDGRNAIVRSVTGETLMCPLQGGEPRPLPFVSADENLVRWSPDGTKLWVSHGSRVESVDLASSHRETVVELGPTASAGLARVSWVTVADDPRAYAYSVWEYSSRLFQIEGVK